VKADGLGGLVPGALLDAASVSVVSVVEERKEGEGEDKDSEGSEKEGARVGQGGEEEKGEKGEGEGEGSMALVGDSEEFNFRESQMTRDVDEDGEVEGEDFELGGEADLEDDSDPTPPWLQMLGKYCCCGMLFQVIEKIPKK
jgi:hypothetical protein